MFILDGIYKKVGNSNNKKRIFTVIICFSVQKNRSFGNGNADSFKAIGFHRVYANFTCTAFYLKKKQTKTINNFFGWFKELFRQLVSQKIFSANVLSLSRCG